MWKRCIYLVLLGFGHAGFADESLKERLQDSHVEQSDFWIYNDIPKAIIVARKQNKPMFVTFRCVPCKECSAFDADVAVGNERIKSLAKDRFISVRQVEMKGVDLSLFQFDYDLNWAAIFVNADGTVYARFGTQSSEGSDAYNSIQGLFNTMIRVLEIHENYPNNLIELKDKRGPAKQVNNAVELPGLRNRSKYAEQTTRQNCIHCHNIHDAEHQHALDTGKYSYELLWKFPLPEMIGLKIDRKHGQRIADVVTDSAAANSRMHAGEEIVRMNGQRITSIADIQWVLQHLPNTNTTVELETTVSGKQTIQLEAGWKRQDFSWRASMWNAPPRFQAWATALSEEEISKRGHAKTDLALEVRWINEESVGGKRMIEDGLLKGDVIVAIAGNSQQMTTRQFNVHVKSNYQVGEILPLTVMRDGKRVELKIHLVE